MRRKIHLRLCVGAVLLALPVAATSTNAVSGTAVASLVAQGEGNAAAQPFGSLVATPAGLLTLADTAQVARRIRAAGDQRLASASPTPTGALTDVDLDDLGIPRTALAAYQVAATTLTQADPTCGIDWTLLAAIGRVESDHGRNAGAHLRATGVSRPLIRGVALDGKGPVAAIRDTDSGRLDGDRTWDRAVGPMQFLPSTWGLVGVDADGDGVRSPDSIHDAALGAAVYLCAAQGRLDRPAGLRTAVYRYNPSDQYVDLVLRLAEAYGEGDLLQLATGGTTLALEAVRTGPSVDGSMLALPAPTGKGTSGDSDARRGDGSRSDGGGGGSSEGDGGAELKDPVQALPGTGTDEPLPGFGPGKTPKPPKDPGPTEGPEPTPDPEPTDEPEPTEEPEPVLTALSGVLTRTEVVGDDGSTYEQWLLTYASVDGAPVADVLLYLGDETWLAQPALSDLDVDGVLETNRDELTGLADSASAIVVQVEAGTEPAVVLTLNGVSYLSSE